MQLLDLDQPAPVPSPRKGWISFLLSLLMPGLGHFYNGRLGLFIFFYFFSFFLPAFIGLFHVMHTFNGLVVVLIFGLLFRMGLAVHATVLSRRQKEYFRKPYNRWYYTLAVFIGLMFFNLFVYDTTSLIGVRAFRIPTPANEPTVMVNDFVMADMHWYQTHEPLVGDMVLYAIQGEIRMHRIVGLPGDRVVFKNDLLYINEKACPQKYIEPVNIEPYFTGTVREESLPNGIKHTITVIDDFKTPPDAGYLRVTVPQNMVFVAGDNRDNSLDSRFVGFIPKTDLIGKLLYSYWGDSWERVGVEF